MNNNEQFRHVSIPMQVILNNLDTKLEPYQLINIIKLMTMGTRYVDLMEFLSDYKMKRDHLEELVNLGLIILVTEDAKILVDLEPIHSQIFNTTTTSKTIKLTAEVIDRIGFLLNRQVKPFELELLREWVDKGHNVDQIEIAIQKAMIKNIDNFNYIQTVLENATEIREEPVVNVKRNIELY